MTPRVETASTICWRTRNRPAASRWASGSSNRNSDGRCTSARPISAVPRWPADSVPGSRLSSPLSPSPAAWLATRCSASSAEHLAGPQRPAHVAGDVHEGHQRVGLEHHRHIAPLRRQPGDVPAVDEHPATTDRVSGRRAPATASTSRRRTARAPRAARQARLERQRAQRDGAAGSRRDVVQTGVHGSYLDVLPPGTRTRSVPPDTETGVGSLSSPTKRPPSSNCRQAKKCHRPTVVQQPPRVVPADRSPTRNAEPSCRYGPSAAVSRAGTCRAALGDHARPGQPSSAVVVRLRGEQHVTRRPPTDTSCGTSRLVNSPGVG